jgi:hypothetical protein
MMAPIGRRNIGLVAGGIFACVAVLAQVLLASALAAEKGAGSPSPGWRLTLGLVLGLLAPAAGVAVSSIDHWSDRTTTERINRGEWVSAAVAIGLIIPTFLLMLVFGTF